VILGDIRTVREGGFSFRPVVGYEVKTKSGQATLISQDGNFVFSLAGSPTPNANTLEGVIDRLLAGVSEQFEGFESSDPYPITIDDSSGLAADVSGELVGKPIAGRVAVVAPAGTQIFYAVGFTVDVTDEQRWEAEGSEVFDAVIDTVDFFDPAISETP
jgi:hypothetical protein